MELQFLKKPTIGKSDSGQGISQVSEKIVRADQYIGNLPDIFYLLSDLSQSMEEKGKLCGLNKMDINIQKLEIQCLRDELYVRILACIESFKIQLSKLTADIKLLSDNFNFESSDRLQEHKNLIDNHLSIAQSYLSDAKIGNGPTKHLDNSFNLGYQKGIVMATQIL